MEFGNAFVNMFGDDDRSIDCEWKASDVLCCFVTGSVLSFLLLTFEWRKATSLAELSVRNGRSGRMESPKLEVP